MAPLRTESSNTQVSIDYEPKVIENENLNASEISPENSVEIQSETLTNGDCVGDSVSQVVFIDRPENVDTKALVTVPLRPRQYDPQTSEVTESFAIPEGLVMDPLAPTTLAVTTEFMDRLGSGLTLLRGHSKKVQKYVWKSRKLDILKKSWKSIVNVVLIEAKELPDSPAGNIYCKFKLGSENHKSKQVSQTKLTWCERFNLYLYEENCLEITVWHKGKQKNFMGRCVVDVSLLEKEKTHDLWQTLDCGYGSIHVLVTICATARSMTMDNVPTTTGVHVPPSTKDYSWYRVSDLSKVGELSVTVHGAKGLSPISLGKADAYCVVELDNARVQTPIVRGSSEPVWDKNYSFEVNDVTSTLDITVYDDSLIKEALGRVSIPLLRIENDEQRWYALKSKSKKSSAKGNCPRICLQMSLVYHPFRFCTRIFFRALEGDHVSPTADLRRRSSYRIETVGLKPTKLHLKASLRVLSPKEQKYTEKTPNKFSIPLLYNNLDFIKDIFHAVCLGNEHFKYLFEWDSTELSAIALTGWLIFWFFFELWMTPLLLLAPFTYYLITSHITSGRKVLSSRSLAMLINSPTPEEDDEEEDDTIKDEKTIASRLHDLQDLTLTIKNGIDYICSLIERVQNLTNFSVPYLSYLTMSVMVALTSILYLIPVNYLFMGFGIYKFTRKYMNPERVPNNDILDFLSRVPDNATLKQWHELKVPEPQNSIRNRFSTN